MHAQLCARQVCGSVTVAENANSNSSLINNSQLLVVPVCEPDVWSAVHDVDIAFDYTPGNRSLDEATTAHHAEQRRKRGVVVDVSRELSVNVVNFNWYIVAIELLIVNVSFVLF